MRGDRDFWGFSGSWGRSEEQRAEEREDALVRMWESNEIGVSRRGEQILIIPEFSAALLFVEAWQRARREQIEQQLNNLEYQMPRCHLSRFLVRIEEGD